MYFNLKTSLKAYPKISPSILENYVTKDELSQKDYVNHTDLNTILADFVRDVEVENDGIIYGRQKGKWVPVVAIKEQENGIICWGMNTSQTLTADGLMALNRQIAIKDVNEYLVEYIPTVNSYYWFASTIPIRGVIANNGLEYLQPIIESTPITIEYNGSPLLFYCYRTPKLVALPGVTYKFKINLGDNS